MRWTTLAATCVSLSLLALPGRAQTSPLIGDDELLPPSRVEPAPRTDGILEDILGGVNSIKNVTDEVPGKFNEVIAKTDQIPSRFNAVTNDIAEVADDVSDLPGDVSNAVANSVTDAVDTAISTLEDEVDGAVGEIEGLVDGLGPLIDSFEDVATGSLIYLPSTEILDNDLLRSVVVVLSEGTQEFIDFYFAAGGDYELIGDILEGCPPTMATDALEDLIQLFDQFLVEEVGISQEIIDGLNLLPPDKYASSEMSFYVKLRFKWYIDLINRGMGRVDYPHPVVTIAKEITMVTTIVLDRLVLCIDSAASQASAESTRIYRETVLDNLAIVQFQLDEESRFTDDSELAAFRDLLLDELAALDAQLVAFDAHVTTLITDLEEDIDDDLAAQSLTSLRLAIQTNLSLNAHFKLLVAVSPDSRNRNAQVSPAMHSFQLPEVEGGHAELVDEIVAETIDTFVDLGLGVNSAEAYLELARAAFDERSYKEAYDHYSRAYHDAVNVQR
ncbi:MAG: hypothetical protein AAF533_19860 [Acidobacteriota bacterium]